MSNFSSNESFNEKNLSFDTESDQNDISNTAAVLEAIEETKNVLKILLQEVIISDNADVQKTLEPDSQSKKSERKDENFNEQEINVNSKRALLLKETAKNRIELRHSSSLVPDIFPTISLNEATYFQSNHLENLNKEHLSPLDQASVQSVDVCDNNTEKPLQLHAKPFDDDDINEISSGQYYDILDNKRDSDHTSLSTLENKLSSELKTSNTNENIPEIPLQQNNFETIPLNKEKLAVEQRVKDLSQLFQTPTSKLTKTKITDLEENLHLPIINTSNYYPSSEPLSTRGLLEPTVSTLEREILLRGDNRKATALKLPPELIPNSPSRCEKEIVGDDFAKTRAHILCECEQAGVAGGAVPVVISFTVPDDCVPKDQYKTSENNAHEKLGAVSKNDTSQNGTHLHSPKPSLIPKLSSSFKNERLLLLGRTTKKSSLISSTSHEEIEERKPQDSKNISLQERLNATTSLIKQQNEKFCHLRFDDDKLEQRKREKKLLSEFSKNINKVAQKAAKLTEYDSLSTQIAAIDNLYQYISELKTISSELNNMRSLENLETCSTDNSQDMNNNQVPSSELGNKAKVKDKIYIKFLPAKLAVRKKKSCNSEAQTEPAMVSYVIETDSVTKEKKEKSNGENISIGVDSMDGMFIPSSEEPPKIEEDEDEDGLDITITFPEFQQHIMHPASSHLSVCFSDISAEALGRLKRCPKEFTLRMDFVHGKMFFQSGKSPANNFYIGPDRKVTECAVDNEISEIISIKPSTECMYTSQIIPVEGAKQKSSTKTLKSTDSELFNVVSLPKINRRTSGVTKSCITFKNERCTSEGCLPNDKRSYKSMPQIPSLTKILEESVSESANTSRAAILNSEKKLKNRTVQKKKPSTILEKTSEARDLI